jgi:uncharacterized membrane protein
METMQTGVRWLIDLVVLICHGLAAFAITVGVLKATLLFGRDLLFGRPAPEMVREGRLELGHAFSLSLGFLIGASILTTAVAPDWTEIGQLAAIIAIRTGLNHILVREIREESGGSLSRQGQ